MKRLLFLGVLLCCALGATTCMGEADMRLENGKACYTFDAATGRLLSVENLKTGTVFTLDGQAGYDITIDPGTGDIWETKPFDARVRELGVQDAAQTVVEPLSGGRLRVRSVYSAEGGQITVERTYALAEGDTALTAQMRVINDAPGVTVLKAQPLSLYWMEDAGQGWSLLWPWHEGEIHAGEVVRMASGGVEGREAGYPVPFSMQYMALFTEAESLYFGVHDAKADHKNFFFRPHGEGQVALGGEQWVYVAPGEAKDCAPVQVALQSEGGWARAADRYRAFIAQDTDWTREHRPIAENFVGWYPFTMAMYPDQYKAAYEKGAPVDGVPTMRQVSATARNKGDIPMVLFLGWHQDGFDARYPDYKFDERMGGEEGFRRAAEAIHADGGQIMMYMNNHLADTLSDWYQTPNAQGGPIGLDCAVRTPEGGEYHETYWTGLDYVAMCPAAQPWIDVNADAVRRLRKNGTDAIWLDQMMEMPSALCYNREHGHDTPATAFNQGYARMMQAFNAVLEEYGDDYLYGCEGVCDAYIQWIDISALMWMRLLGFAPESAPETTRYTLPAKILGLPGHNAPGKHEYARAFLMGEPILAREPFNALIKAYVGLYRQYPDIYLSGRYEGVNGIKDLPQALQAGVMLAGDGTRAAVQLYNPGTEAVTATLGYDAPTGLVSAVDGFTGADVLSGEGTFDVTLEPGDTAAVIVSWH